MRGSEHNKNRSACFGGSGNRISDFGLRVQLLGGAVPWPWAGDEVVLQRVRKPGLPVDPADAAAGHRPFERKS